MFNEETMGTIYEKQKTDGSRHEQASEGGPRGWDCYRLELRSVRGIISTLTDAPYRLFQKVLEGVRIHPALLGNTDAINLVLITKLV